MTAVSVRTLSTALGCRSNEKFMSRKCCMTIIRQRRNPSPHLHTFATDTSCCHHSPLSKLRRNFISSEFQTGCIGYRLITVTVLPVLCYIGVKIGFSLLISLLVLVILAFAYCCLPSIGFLLSTSPIIKESV